MNNSTLPLTAFSCRVQFDIWLPREALSQKKWPLRLQTFNLKLSVFKCVLCLHQAVQQNPFLPPNETPASFFPRCSCQRLTPVINCCYASMPADWWTRRRTEAACQTVDHCSGRHFGSGTRGRTEWHPDGLWTRITHSALRDWIDLPSVISVNTAQHAGVRRGWGRGGCCSKRWHKYWHTNKTQNVHRQSWGGGEQYKSTPAEIQ